MFMNVFSKKAKAAYRVLDHTADLRIRVEGPDRRAEFRQDLCALYDLQFKRAPGPADHDGAMEIQGLDMEDLLIKMLNECIYRFQAEAEVFCEIAIDILEQGRLVAACRNRNVNLPDLYPEAEIKAATYHDLKIEKTKDGYGVNIVFDM